MLRRTILPAGLILLPAIMTAAIPAAGQPSLVPPPREVRWTGQPPLPLPQDRVAIVLGDQAGEPEAYAAELLGKLVARRFGRTWPVVREREAPAGGVVLLLGLRSTHRLLDGMCTRHGRELNVSSPGHDGYLIHVPPADGGRPAVLVGGSNARGVIYGADTLFQLIEQRAEGLVLHRASIRDWPTVPWRGRPHTHYDHYLREGELDAFMISRINWIDLRDGIYAFEPGAKLDKAAIARVIAEARRRDLVVYGTVNCGVPQSQHEAVLTTFREFIGLGVDGLWLSFDDKGPGETTETLVWQVLELAREAGIGPERIAVCPPKGAYQDITASFSRRLLAMPGLQQAMVFWTRVPCAADAEEARRLGLAVKPSWWHNWIRPASGFTHVEGGSQLSGGRRSYLELQPLASGWHAPTAEDLAEAADHVHSVIPWGGTSWNPYYVAPAIGWWGWSGKQCDFQAVRGRVYDIVFGPAQVETARDFDDRLTALRSRFIFTISGTPDAPLCPPRPAPGVDAAAILGEVDALQKLVDRLEARAPAESLLKEDEVRAGLLGPMREELAVAGAAAATTFPEQWWPARQCLILDAVGRGDRQEAAGHIEQARGLLLEQIDRIAGALGQLRMTGGYAAWWKRRAELDVAGWEKLVADRREEFQRRVWWYAYTAIGPADLIRESANPPLDWGTGRWQVRNRVRARVLPQDRETFWGDWMAGVHVRGDCRAAVFACRHHIDGDVGDFSELPVEVPLSGDRSCLALMICMGNANKDEIGLHHVPDRWAGCRVIRLLHDDRTLWEADLGRRREKGEWFVVPLPPVPADRDVLRLRLRVEETRETRAFGIVAVAPILLVELPPHP